MRDIDIVGASDPDGRSEVSIANADLEQDTLEMAAEHETVREPREFEVRGSLSIDGRRGVLRYEVVVPASAGVVWGALTDPERLGAWYGRVEGELRVGGRYHAVLFPSGWEGDGKVLTCEPESRLRMESGEPGEPATIDDLELIPQGGRTRLILTRSRPSADMLDACCTWRTW